MKKIPFNDRYLLTKAVLEGRKIQTRRLVPKGFFSLTWDEREDTLVYENDFGEFIDIRYSKYALYKKGEIVAVAQSYKEIDDFYKTASLLNHSIYDCVSDADIQKWNMIAVNYRGKTVWTNKLFVKPDLMVHFIQITNVRIERLQDISDNDCIKEGIEFDCKSNSYYCGYNKKTNSKIWLGSTTREAYASLIDKVGKKGDWNRNPYVFVYDFKLIK